MEADAADITCVILQVYCQFDAGAHHFLSSV